MDPYSKYFHFFFNIHSYTARHKTEHKFHANMTTYQLCEFEKNQ